jgi:7-cyano-7-deazaguanine reductase
MSSVDTSNLRALGENSKPEEGLFNGPHASLLERFSAPSRPEVRRFDTSTTIDIKCPEFTSLCPKTGQPDFATIKIAYVPRDWCVESKSLKLYLMSFRNAGEFHEACIQRMAEDLIGLLDPDLLEVRGEFTPRGGIPFWPTVCYMRPDPSAGLTV